MRSTKLPLWTERLLGIDPIPVSPHVFALDPFELRYGSVHRGPKGLVFEASQSMALSPEIFGEGVLGAPLREPKAFWEALEELVSTLPAPVKEASLVLPDTWFRLTFTELTELPRKRSARQDVLRWKLKRLVPFRIEDLRVSATRVSPFPSQEEPLRLLLGFAIEVLLSQIEEGFSAVGIELGQITNTTLALLASLEHNVEPDDLAALVAVYPDAFTLSYVRQGEPLLYRYKAFAESANAESPQSVRRDLRLTTSFIRRHFPDVPLARAFLAASPELEEPWLDCLSEELDVTPEPLAFEHFRLSRTQVGPSWLETAPLLGAASLEVR